MEFIVDFNNVFVVDVINFVKEVVEKFLVLCLIIVFRLVDILKEVCVGKVYWGILWIIGEYFFEEKDICDVWKGIRVSLGEIFILVFE